MSIKLDWEVSDAPDDTGKLKSSAKTQWSPAAKAAAPPTAAPATAASNPAAQRPTPPAAPTLTPTAPPSTRRRLWSWSLAALAALAVVALGATWYISRQGWQRVQGDIEALVRYEEEAAYAGQVNLVLAVQDQDNRDWLQVRQDQLVAARPAPPPLPVLALTTPAFAIDAVTALDGDFVTALVRREFATAEGQTLAFVLPQFYRRRGLDDWQRTAPPGQFWGQWVDWRGTYVQVRHSERDAALVAEFAPRIEAWLSDTCALWLNRCGAVLPAKLFLSGFVGSLEYDPLANVEVRVEVGNGNGSGALAADYFLSVPSPQIAGVPTDAAGRDYLAEYLAVRLIASLADRATETTADYAALTARAIASLGLGRADPGFAALPSPQAEAEAQPDAAPDPAPTRTSAQATQAAPRIVFYTVQAGDTLSGIAQVYGVSVEALLETNGLTDPDVILAGTVLSIPLPQ